MYPRQHPKPRAPTATSIFALFNHFFTENISEITGRVKKNITGRAAIFYVQERAGPPKNRPGCISALIKKERKKENLFPNDAYQLQLKFNFILKLTTSWAGPRETYKSIKRRPQFGQNLIQKLLYSGRPCIFYVLPHYRIFEH